MTCFKSKMIYLCIINQSQHKYSAKILNPQTKIQKIMSNERKEVIDMTVTENDLNELRESNANLIEERKNLMEKISELEKSLKREKEDHEWAFKIYQREKEKVRSLALIIKAMKCDESIGAVVVRICDMV